MDIEDGVHWERANEEKMIKEGKTSPKKKRMRKRFQQ